MYPGVEENIAVGPSVGTVAGDEPQSKGVLLRFDMGVGVGGRQGGPPPHEGRSSPWTSSHCHPARAHTHTDAVLKQIMAVNLDGILISTSVLT